VTLAFGPFGGDPATPSAPPALEAYGVLADSDSMTLDVEHRRALELLDESVLIEEDFLPLG
jgi:hypothetical protein